MINKILERLEEEKGKAEKRYDRYADDGNLSCLFDMSDIAAKRVDTIKEVISIVQEVAQEYGKKYTYEITLEGCDDDTTFFIALTMDEYLLLERVARLANETSTYACMPRMLIEPYDIYQPKGE